MLKTLAVLLLASPAFCASGYESSIISTATGRVTKYQAGSYSLVASSQTQQSTATAGIILDGPTARVISREVKISTLTAKEGDGAILISSHTNFGASATMTGSSSMTINSGLLRIGNALQANGSTAFGILSSTSTSGSVLLLGAPLGVSDGAQVAVRGKDYGAGLGGDVGIYAAQTPTSHVKVFHSNASGLAVSISSASATFTSSVAIRGDLLVGGYSTFASSVTISSGAFGVGNILSVKDGKVGLGTMSPQTAADINGATTIRGQLTTTSSITINSGLLKVGSGVLISGSGSPGIIYRSDEAGYLSLNGGDSDGGNHGASISLFGNAHGSVPGDMNLEAGRIGGDPRGRFKFYDALQQNVVSISSVGVSVRTYADPIVALDVAGAVKLAGATTITSSMSVVGGFQVGASTLVVTEGKVGVNDPTPTNTLDITGTLGLDDIQVADIVSGDIVLGNPAGGGTEDVKIAAGGDYRITALATGNVGVATTTPSHPLTINSSQAQQLRWQYSTHKGLTGWADTTYAGLHTTGGTGGSGFFVRDDATKYVALSADGNQVLTGLASGNVGINTPTPSYKLHVVGGTIAVTGGGVFLSDNQGKTGYALNSSGSDYGLITNPSSDLWALGHGTSLDGPGTGVVYWNDSNDVGISTGSPQKKFHIVSDSQWNGAVIENTAGNPQLWLRDNTLATANKNLGFEYSSGGLALQYDTSGSYGAVGTASWFGRTGGFYTLGNITAGSAAQGSTLQVNSGSATINNGSGDGLRILSGDDNTYKAIEFAQGNAPTASYALGVDQAGNGNLNLRGGNPVNLSGTPLMAWDRSNSRVGILNETPATTLDVVGAAQFGTGATRSTFTADGGLKVPSYATFVSAAPSSFTNTGEFYSWGVAEFGGKDKNYGNLSVKNTDGNTQAFFPSYAGSPAYVVGRSFGVGTENPGATFQVSAGTISVYPGTTDIPGVGIYDGAGINTFGLGVDSSRSSWGGALYFNNTKRLFVGTNNGTALGTYANGTTNPPANGLIFDGQLGVGTPSPASKLDISQGTARQIRHTYSATHWTTMGVEPGSSNWAAGIEVDGARVMSLQVSSGVAIGDYYLEAAPTNGLILPGSLGVGVIAPAVKLDMAAQSELGLGVFTQAQLNAKTPGKVGTLVFNSDILEVCVSTGTSTALAYKRIDGGASCQ